MQIEKDFDLTGYNTFGVKAIAENFAVFSQVEELKELTEKFDAHPFFILGGGSNILFTKDVGGLVLKNQIKGIEIKRETESEVCVRAGAGVVWHDLVMFCVERNFGGVENLSLIPGSVGASPMQNIGAYGAEIKDTFMELEAMHLRERYVRKFTGEECRFGYRESVFKNTLKNQFAILNVTCRLSKKPKFNITYGMLGKKLEEMQVQQLSVKAISDAVIAIRRSKLPDPKNIGNAGSFFKNPVVDISFFEKLHSLHPEIPHYQSGEKIKIPAAWLIEQCGFKGYRKGNVGCYALQPLVIVNHGGASGEEIFSFSEDIIRKVNDRFGILLSREVNVF